MTALLITQCLQNDFVKPIKKNESLPNFLHIGYEESKRLLGDNLTINPLTQFMSWVEKQSRKQLYTVHIRDWHDSSDPIQKGHLAQFGDHCLKDSNGAEFIFDFKESSSSKIINSTTLNDFESTELQVALEPFADQPVNVGIIGVWTEAKVLFLAYELATRYPNFNLYVCSALTASSSRSHHFAALEQLKRIVGIRVIDSVGEFIECLGGQSNETPLSYSSSTEMTGLEHAQIEQSDYELLRYLFRDCKKVTFKVLEGGFSGNFVGKATSIDSHGYEQVPHVIKIGEQKEMAQERTAFERVEALLGNTAPQIADFADFRKRGAIKYRYASMNGGKVETLQSKCEAFIRGELPEKHFLPYLDSVFSKQLGRLYRSAIEDKHNLLEYYQFSSNWAESVKQKIEGLIGPISSHDTLNLPGQVQAYNLYKFYKNDLSKLQDRFQKDYLFSYVHGDLNGANVIIDENDNTWVIDFFHTHHGHLLKDFIKFENDLCFIYTPIENQQDLKLAFQFTDFLLLQESPVNLSELPDIFLGRVSVHIQGKNTIGQ
ncbi:isochorismatase family protein [Pleionea mediterranea]|uniref:Nicotinamidase-related amidase n=1 Tax=Pleionea mediterranea TaxID=523701 RepID=A0A316FNP0_9GAMM|nr:isochorismatase family protein [Pleionea mediterranea]PWK49873.1 nicotinamidase-related amidase [Pleionea mediterranea]